MIFGVESHQPLPDGWTPLEAVVVVKCLNEEGVPTLFCTCTDGLSSHEQAGLFLAGLDEARADMGAAFDRGFAEEEEE